MPRDRIVLMAIVFYLLAVTVSVPAGEDATKLTDSKPLQLRLSASPSYGVVPQTVRFRLNIAAGSSIDCAKHKVNSYLSKDASVALVEDVGRTLKLVGNGGKALELAYHITPRTVLEFDFKSGLVGVAQGIGLDDDDTPALHHMFELFGNEWPTCFHQYHNYSPTGASGASNEARDFVGDPQWRRFRIPIGQYHTGPHTRIYFINRYDVDDPRAAGWFRDVVLYEDDFDETCDISWSFGDGQQANGGRDVEHTYRQPGNYQAQVTVVRNGQSHSAATDILVRKPNGSPRYLFIDDEAVDAKSGFKRVTNVATKHPANPVLRPESPDKPWEWRAQSFGTTHYDSQLEKFRMWYLAFRHPNSPPFTVFGKRVGFMTNYLAYAESKDGVAWNKPSLGLVDFQGSRENNLIVAANDEVPHACGWAILDEPHDPDLARRFKAIYWNQGPPGGMCVSFSPDGLRWTPWQGNPVRPEGSDTGHSVLWDARIEKYVMYGRMNVGRRVSRMESPDFVNWSEPQLVFAADQHDRPGDQIYGISAALYEGMYLALAWMYHIGDDLTIDVQLIHSRDGIHWQRTADRKPIIPLGPPGTWDSGILFTSAGSTAGFPIKHDRIHLYYFGMEGIHAEHPDPEETDRYWRGGIGLATLRRDGWVSLDAGVSDGHVITKPVEIPSAQQGDTHPRLLLNIDAFAGDVWVTLLDENGSPIAGFENSNNLHGDFLRAEVTWPDHTLAKLADREVKLKIHGRLAKLYSYWFE